MQVPEENGSSLSGGDGGPEGGREGGGLRLGLKYGYMVGGKRVWRQHACMLTTQALLPP